MAHHITKQSVLFENLSKKAVIAKFDRITPAPTAGRFCSRRAMRSSS